MVRHLRAWGHRVLGLLWNRRRSWDFDAELQSHVELHTADLMRSGVGPAEAHRRALLALGGVTEAKERIETAWDFRA